MFEIRINDFSVGLNKKINEPLHITKHFSPSIDLLFACRPNLVTESGISKMWYTNSHQQMVIFLNLTKNF